MGELTTAHRIRRWLRMGPTRAELTADAKQWRSRYDLANMSQHQAHARAKDAERRLRQAQITISDLLDAHLNEPDRVDGCSKVRFHQQAEADEWADGISSRTGEQREMFTTYGCKLCPRSPVTNRKFFHVGHGGSEAAQASKAAARQDRIARLAAARRGGKLVGQRLDPTVLAQLRKISEPADTRGEKS